MRPITLTMQAFGSYGQKTTIDFREPVQNLFLITGDTGSGKTTIFDALVFALYGEASSKINKKDGRELASDFAERNVYPYVELTFSENEGGREQEYVVRREPVHYEYKKNGERKASPASERVSLAKKDEPEFSGNVKEINARLEEIVGLSKSQFMQVAMIAQGEFMEMLRASSKDKKPIFRKLFDTGIYENIVRELEGRKKEREDRMQVIRIACQNDVNRIEVPAEYEGESRLRDMIRRIAGAEELVPEDLEKLTEELKALCEVLGAEAAKAEKAAAAAEAVRDEKSRAYTRGMTLKTSFDQLEKAERTLEECREQAEAMAEQERLRKQIAAAWEIGKVYDRRQDAEKLCQRTGKDLAELRERIPGLRQVLEEAQHRENIKETTRSRAQDAFTRVDDRAGKAIQTLRGIRAAERNLKIRQEELEQAQMSLKKARGKLEELAEQEKERRREQEALSGAEIAWTNWENRRRRGEELTQEYQDILQEEVRLRRAEQRAEKAAVAYVAAKREYEEADGRYQTLQEAFYDAQAGLIAREKLKPGMPCPVCGSREHPAPCRLQEEHGNLSREKVDTAKGLSDRAQSKMRDTSDSAGRAEQDVQSLRENFGTRMETLRKRLGEEIPQTPETLTVKIAGRLLEEHRKELTEEGTRRERDRMSLESTNRWLAEAEERKQRLTEFLETARKAEHRAAVEMEKARTQRDGLETDLEYPSEKDAEAARMAARTDLQAAEKGYEEARRKSAAAKTELDSTLAKVQKNMEELPKQQEAARAREKEYRDCMEERDLSEYEWKSLTAEYPQSECDRIDRILKAYAGRKAEAEGARKTARETIGGQAKPDPEALLAEKEAGENACRGAREEMDRVKGLWKNDLGVSRSLSPRLETNRKLVEEYTRINNMYRRLSGRVSGFRMDLETFVQRYYLERILQAANRRFYIMTGGQYELRVLPEEEAGDGKNRGLDLNVFSTVTGQEREARTLSGGESFMAALALALGMADQIQEGTSSIHLDMMFIDEGFGSLDDTARGQAIQILQQMAGGDKLIGIISHVTELKTAIDDQLVVTKDREGSHVRWRS